MAGKLCLQNSDKLVGIFHCSIHCLAYCFTNRKFPGNKRCNCEPGKKFENGIIMKLRLYILLTLSTFYLGVRAQYAAPSKDSLYSKILGEQRNIVITLPIGYGIDNAQ